MTFEKEKREVRGTPSYTSLSIIGCVFCLPYSL